MRNLTLALGIALASAAAVALAAPGYGGGYGPGYGPGSGACAQKDPATCPGGGPGMRGGRMGGMGPMAGGLMTDEERAAHRDAMHALQTVEQCNAYWSAHREAMANRARERGLEPGPGPRFSPCERMAARGLLSR